MPRSAATRREFLRSAAALVAASVTQPCWFPAQAAGTDKSKSGLTVYMDWDMEGVSGLFTREQVWFWEKGVRSEVAEEGRKLLVADVNSAAAATLAAGADRVIVFDTHHGGGNLRREEMLSDSRITYQLKSPDKGASFRWMAGLDATVDGLMLMGHHAKAGTERAFLPHTWMAEWADFSINGKSVGEIGIEACNAGHWGVPLIMAQGDEAMCKEVETQFPGTVTTCVKRAVSGDLCSGPDAQAARQLTAEKVADAISKLRSSKPAPYKPSLPMRVAVRMKSERSAEAAAKKPGRVGPTPTPSNAT